MRTLAITQNITVDGVIDLSDGWFSPADDDDRSDVLEALLAQDARSDALLLGRQTFETSAATGRCRPTTPRASRLS